MTITRSWRRWWLLLLPLLLVLSGCMRVNLDADVSSDNLVSGSMVFAFDDDIMDLLPQDEQSMQDDLASEGCDLPNSTVTPYAQDGYTGVSCTFSGVTLDEFNGDAADEG
jgi:hypothetical protein